MRSSALRVTLIWPGGLLEPSGSFGVPQMLNLARAIERRTSATVQLLDLDMERAFAPGQWLELCTGSDVIGISCYSSFDYLKVMEIARVLRSKLPDATLVTGGYHPSACPGDFTRPGSPFDYVIVGDGEVSFCRLLQHIEAGRTPLQRVLGPESLPSPTEVMPYDWSLLDRYKGVARRLASQVEIYLSRGCPYDCSFCMERAKRDTAWRALEPEAAVDELQHLDQALDLSTWTLRISDPLFGMKRSWRRTFLEELIRRPLRSRKTWLVLRVDLVEREDIELMSRANVALGLGLESGDPGQLRRIRKTGMLSTYLDKMIHIAEWARQYKVPFGANVIVGHPGETEASLRTSERYLRRLFLEGGKTYGFLAVDPFRLYPGSPIADDLDSWIAQTGMKVHRYPWWEDGDPAFLAEWIDPSAELDYEHRCELTHELFGPLVHDIRSNFGYEGPAQKYFQRALDRELLSFTREAQATRRELLDVWSTIVAAAPRASSPVQETRVTEFSGILPAPEWARAVLHVLAHLDVGAIPSSLFDPVYLEFAETYLGAIEQRPLGAFVRSLSEHTWTHADFARLQGLCTRFETVAIADETLPLLNDSELNAYGPLARRVCQAVVEEAQYWTRLPVLRPRAELTQALHSAAQSAPALRRLKLQTVDALRTRARLVGDTIWLGTPHDALRLDPEPVALQAAHEATLSEILSEQRTAAGFVLSERQLEQLALERLSERRDLGRV
jgi:anaerobic magnesium-protoporphyrin IX monomethyl ester cyclase